MFVGVCTLVFMISIFFFVFYLEEGETPYLDFKTAAVCCFLRSFCILGVSNLNFLIEFLGGDLCWLAGRIGYRSALADAT